MIPPHLTLPEFALVKFRAPKWSRLCTIADVPAKLRSLVPNEPAPLDRRDEAQVNARECRLRARRNRNTARKTYGDNGGPSPCPVSGGICNHWPEDAKDDVADYERLAARWDDIARAWHAYAGKRQGTYPAALSYPSALS